MAEATRPFGEENLFQGQDARRSAWGILLAGHRSKNAWGSLFLWGFLAALTAFFVWKNWGIAAIISGLLAAGATKVLFDSGKGTSLEVAFDLLVVAAIFGVGGFFLWAVFQENDGKTALSGKLFFPGACALIGSAFLAKLIGDIRKLKSSRSAVPILRIEGQLFPILPDYQAFLYFERAHQPAAIMVGGDVRRILKGKIEGSGRLLRCYGCGAVWDELGAPCRACSVDSAILLYCPP